MGVVVVVVVLFNPVPTVLRMRASLSRSVLKARCLLQGPAKGQMDASEFPVRMLLEALR